MTAAPSVDERPDPTTITNRKEFGQALTTVRTLAGLTIRDVTVATGIAKATLGGYFTGRHLPPVKMAHQLVSVLNACGITDPDTVRQWQQALIRLRDQSAWQGDDPYRGLLAFQPEDSDWFFGRSAVTATLLDELAARRRDPAPLLVVGASGSGKSSVLRAGLLAALRRGALAGGDSAGWPQVLLTPGATPVEALAAALADVPADVTGPLVIAVDQFEELFVAGVDERERDAFLDALAELCGNGSALVVLAMRADFFGAAVNAPGMASIARRGQVVVGAMTEAELREAIEGPASKAGIDVESGLVELLLHDLAPALPTPGAHDPGAHDPGALPLLSHALRVTWQRSKGRRLTGDDYRAAGGIRGAVGRSADEVYEALPGEQQRIARSIFLRLVHVDEHTADTRRHAPHTEFADERPGGASPVAEVLDRFIDARLITSTADTVAISHEALLSAWPKLRDWLDTDRAGIRLHRRLGAAAQRWQESDRDPDQLYRGAPLASAESWAGTEHPVLTKMEREFLTGSLQRRDAEHVTERRRTRRLRQMVAGLLVLLLATGGLTAYVVYQAGAAAHARDLAVSRQLATQADTLRGKAVSLANQLAVAAYRIAPTPQARSSLLDASATTAATRLVGPQGLMQSAAVAPGGDVLATITGGAVQLWDLAREPRPVRIGTPLQAGSGTLFALAVSPDGHTLAAAGSGGTVLRWDITDPAHATPLAALPHIPDTIYSLDYSTDGALLAVGDAGGAVTLWRTGGDRPVRLGAVPAGPAVHAVALAPAGHTLATAGEQGSVRLWDISSPDRPRPFGAPLTGFHGTVYDVAFSPDGETLAAGGRDRTVRIWHLADGTHYEPAGTLSGFSSWVNTVAISGDGRLLAAGSSDNTVRLWRLPSLRPVAVLPHAGPVTSATFLPGGHRLLTSAADGTARIWQLPGPVISGAAAVFSVDFGPGGQSVMLASSGQDAGLRFWNVHGPGAPAPPGSPVSVPGSTFSGAAALSPDGSVVAAGNTDGSVQLFDVRDRAHIVPLGRPLPLSQAMVENVSFSPDGGTLAVGGDDHTVRLVDVSDPRHPRLRATLTGPTNYVFDVAFSADGRLLAAAGADNTVHIWLLAGDGQAGEGQPLPVATLHRARNYAYTVAFAPRGRLLAVGSADKSVRLWDLSDPRDPRLVATLTGPANYVDTVAFSPDGKTLAAGSTDHTIWLWNVTDPAHPSVKATLRAAADPVFAVAFSPDGHTLVAGDAAHAVHLWRTDPDAVASRVCASAGTPISRHEWRQYVPDLPYQPPCR